MLSIFLSRQVLLNRRFLWLLFIVNSLGTIYGYYWYAGQLKDTVNSGHPLWQLVFVPDSPTGSLFFTLSLLYLLFPPRSLGPIGRTIRVFIEAMGAVTSFKYGIWAVSMIVAGAARGDVLQPEHYMLIVSHLGMAAEALLYARFLKFGRWAAAAAFAWLLLNDYCDYHFVIYPYLPRQLYDVVPAVEKFTFGLSVVSLLMVWLALAFRRQPQPVA